MIDRMRVVFIHARPEAIAYFSTDILLCIVASSQLIILQMIIDEFAENVSHGAVGGMGILALSAYFLFIALLGSVKEKIHFQLEKKLTAALGTEMAATVNGLDYTCYEDKKLYDMVEKVSDKPYLHFIKAFTSFSRVISIFVQLLVIFVYLVYNTRMGAVLSGCLVAAIFFFDYKIMITSDTLENEKLPEERRMKYYLNLFFRKNDLYEMRILQTENFFMKKIQYLMKIVSKKRLKISLRTQKYYGLSCLLLCLWTVWVLFTIGIQVYEAAIPVGALLASIKMIDMVSGLSGDFSEEYVACGEELQKISYFEKLKTIGESNAK